MTVLLTTFAVVGAVLVFLAGRRIAIGEHLYVRELAGSLLLLGAEGTCIVAALRSCGSSVSRDLLWIIPTVTLSLAIFICLWTLFTSTTAEFCEAWAPPRPRRGADPR